MMSFTCRTKRSGLLTAVVLILLCVSCKSIFAPGEGDLRGWVTDDVGRVVAGAQVRTSPGAKTATTNSAGEFVLKTLGTGTCTLTASKAGYEDQSAKASLPETGGISCATPDGDARIGGLSLEGWTFYVIRDLDGAVTRFEETLAADADCVDAHNGLGWSYALLDSLEDSAAGFGAALQIDSTFIDAWAGLAFVRSALEDHEGVVTAVEAVLDEEGDGYTFRRDAEITSADLRLLSAQSQFHLGNYSEAQEHVDILDPDNGLDPATSGTWWVGGVQYPTYEEALLAELELLGT